MKIFGIKVSRKPHTSTCRECEEAEAHANRKRAVRNSFSHVEALMEQTLQELGVPPKLEDKTRN